MRKYPIIFCVLITLSLFTACSPLPVMIEGTAMLPGFKNGDRVLMDKNLGELKRGEVIIFLYPKDTSKSYIKRIIALPNETVEIKDGKVLINGQILDEPYLDQSYNQSFASFPSRKIAENNYFVLGDNRDNSSDSRYWGSVSKDLIKAKYYTTYLKGE